MPPCKPHSNHKRKYIKIHTHQKTTTTTTTTTRERSHIMSQQKVSESQSKIAKKIKRNKRAIRKERVASKMVETFPCK